MMPSEALSLDRDLRYVVVSRGDLNGILYIYQWSLVGAASKFEAWAAVSAQAGRVGWELQSQSIR
jgi:hypothetical protein